MARTPRAPEKWWTPAVAAGWPFANFRQDSTLNGTPFVFACARVTWSNSLRIPVDIPAEDQGAGSPDLHVNLVTDGKTWDRWRVKAGRDSSLSLWARGIPDSIEKKQVLVLLNGINLPAIYISATDAEQLKQVNATLPAGLRPGKFKLRLQCANQISEPVNVELV